jgi:hypothetical protein
MSLSDRIFEAEPLNDAGKPDGFKERVVHEYWLREAIKELKKEFTERSSVLTPRDSKWVLSKIDKTFGNALSTKGEAESGK